MNDFKSVIIEVRGGVVYVIQKSLGVKVEIRDYDILDCEENQRKEYSSEIYTFNDEITPKI